MWNHASEIHQADRVTKMTYFSIIWLLFKTQRWSSPKMVTFCATFLIQRFFFTFSPKYAISKKVCYLHFKFSKVVFINILWTLKFRHFGCFGYFGSENVFATCYKNCTNVFFLYIWSHWPSNIFFRFCAMTSHLSNNVRAYFFKL